MNPLWASVAGLFHPLCGEKVLQQLATGRDQGTHPVKTGKGRGNKPTARQQPPNP